MKKVSVLLFLLILSGSAIKLQAQTAQETAANNTIEMTNSVISMYNNYIRNLKNVETGLERAEENYEVLRENPKRTAHGFNCSNFTINSYEQSAYEKATKAAPAFAEKAKIQTAVDFVIKNTEEFGKRCLEMTTYFNKREHENDTEFVKYQLLYDSLYSMYERVTHAWEIALNLSSEVGDRCEIVLLKNSPISEFIIPMKEDIGKARKLMSKFSADEPDLAGIKNAIATIKKDIVANRSLTGKRVANLEKYSNKNYFEGFYLTMDDFIEYATQLSELLDPKVEIEDLSPSRRNDRIGNLYSMLNGKMNSLIGHYNEM